MDGGDLALGLSKGVEGFLSGYMNARKLQLAERQAAGDDEDRKRRGLLTDLQVKKAERELDPNYVDPSVERERFGKIEDRLFSGADKGVKAELPPEIAESMQKKGFLTQFKKDPKTAGLVTDPLKALRIQKLKQEMSAGPKLTEEQSKAAGFYSRASRANEALEQLYSDPEFKPAGYLEQAKSNLPKWMGGGISEQEQVLKASKLAFVASVLRKESGAAVTPDEFAQYDGMYFPQPGDGPKVTEFKRQLRNEFLNSLQTSAGPGMTQQKVDARKPLDLTKDTGLPKQVKQEMKTVGGKQYRKVKGGWELAE